MDRGAVPDPGNPGKHKEEKQLIKLISKYKKTLLWQCLSLEFKL
jgi:hypothetical protein